LRGRRGRVSPQFGGGLWKARCPALLQTALGMRSCGQFAEDKSDGDHSRTRHYGCASSSACASITRPQVFRVSLVREVVREIHNLFWRIGEIRRRGLDRVGMQIDPCPEIPLPHEQRESVLACCIQDTHNLCKSRPVTSPIEVELFVRGWEAGAAWLFHMSLPSIRNDSLR
jgi:hypothetical protein